MSDNHTFPQSKHDHDACVADALDKADLVCAQRGVRLTPQRRRILEIVWASHKPIGAYDVLEILNCNGGRSAPMTVYRALDFLMEQGLVHRLASLNAFLGCAHPHEQHNSYFLICQQCNQAAELEDTSIQKAILTSTKSTGFTVQSQLVEIQGLCQDCRPKS